MKYLTATPESEFGNKNSFTEKPKPCEENS